MDEGIGDEAQEEFGRYLAGFQHPLQDLRIEGVIAQGRQPPAHRLGRADDAFGCEREKHLEPEDHHCQGDDNGRKGIEGGRIVILLHFRAFPYCLPSH